MLIFAMEISGFLSVKVFSSCDLRKIDDKFAVKRVFKNLFFAVLLLGTMAEAQKKDSVDKVLKPTITLNQGATLFSSDPAFNNQISSKKIVRDHAEIVANNKKDSKNLQMKTPNPGAESMSDKKQLLDEEKRKKNDSISKTKKNKNS